MHHARSAAPGVQHRHWLCAFALCLAVGAAAKDPPLDPWSDSQWRGAVAGLKMGDVRSVRWVEQQFDAGAGIEPAVASSQSRRFTFGDDGRLVAFDSQRARRGERDEARQLRYQWGERGELQRIDEEGVAEPLLQRRVDAAGRLTLLVERRGEALERTTVQYDAAGRERERIVERGQAAARVRERRSYHPNGALKSIETDTKGAPSRTITFDPLGRPVKISSRDKQALRVTQIRYPSSLTAVYDDSAAILSGGGLRRYTREISFRVRRTDELTFAGEPEQPLSRREVRDGASSETQTEFDEAGRPLRRRQLVGERVRCVIEWQYHASGLLQSARSRQGDDDARCPDSPDLDAEIEVDERGNWVRQVVHATHADGRRVRTTERSREIDYR
jgi:YD repeat-containing protein